MRKRLSIAHGPAAWDGKSTAYRRLQFEALEIRRLLAAVGFVLLPWTADAIGLQQTVLLLATLLTVVSGAQILRRGYIDWQRPES